MPGAASEERKVRQVAITSAVHQHLVWPGQPQGLDTNSWSPQSPVKRESQPQLSGEDTGLAQGPKASTLESRLALFTKSEATLLKAGTGTGSVLP